MVEWVSQKGAEHLRGKFESDMHSHTVMGSVPSLIFNWITSDSERLNQVEPCDPHVLSLPAWYHKDVSKTGLETWPCSEALKRGSFWVNEISSNFVHLLLMCQVTRNQRCKSDDSRLTWPYYERTVVHGWRRKRSRLDATLHIRTYIRTRLWYESGLTGSFRRNFTLPERPILVKNSLNHGDNCISRSFVPRVYTNEWMELPPQVLVKGITILLRCPLHWKCSNNQERQTVRARVE